MWFGSLLDLFPAASRAGRPRKTRDQAQRRRQSRRLLFESLDARRVLAFSPFEEFAAGNSAQVQVAGDFTGDGQLDLVVSSAAGLALHRGNGDGTLQSPLPISPVQPFSLAAGDLDGDGNLDLVTNREILLGNGDGTFQPPIAIDLPPQVPAGYHSPVPQQSGSVAVGDLNDDGKLDVTVTGRSTISFWVERYGYLYYYGYSSGHVNVLLGNGDGTVTHSSITDFPQQGNDRLALADLNGDDALDLIAAPGSYPLAFRFLNSGDGTLGTSAYFNTGNYPGPAVILGDFDEDGNLDHLNRGSYSGFNLMRGLGDGNFENPVPFTPDQSNEYPTSVAVGDINDDGHLDIAFTTQRIEVTATEARFDYWGNPYDVPIAGIVHDSVKVILGHGDGTFSAPITSQLGSREGLTAYLHTSLLGDFDGDGLLDLAAADRVLGILTVALNDGNWVPPPSLSIQDVSIVEGTGGTTNAVFTVTLDGTPSGSVSVNFTTQDQSAVAGLDYTATSGTLTFGPGVTSRTISVPILGDSLDEFDETFGVLLTSPVNAVLVDSYASGTILDDDAAPTISIADVSRSEGNRDSTQFTFTATLSAPSAKWITFTYTTADGTATVGGNDYYSTGGWTVAFAPGETANSFIEVYVRGDRTREANETFFVNLANAVEATIADGQAVGTITNDDGGQTRSPPQLRIGDASITEGHSGTRQLVFTVTLSETSNELVRVNFATRDDRAKASDNDYVAKSGVLEFAPGQRTRTISITINGDRKREDDESFYVELSGALGADIADARGRGKIRNDDRR